uniref:Uncharacterized protein n=1 Tax=viral metagenome TaxID=1070528 RepID=A0A6C0CZA2_9ZZZZ
MIIIYDIYLLFNIKNGFKFIYYFFFNYYIKWKQILMK